jgi:hypothetical protein
LAAPLRGLLLSSLQSICQIQPPSSHQRPNCTTTGFMGDAAKQMVMFLDERPPRVAAQSLYLNVIHD